MMRRLLLTLVILCSPYIFGAAVDIEIIHPTGAQVNFGSVKPNEFKWFKYNYESPDSLILSVNATAATQIQINIDSLSGLPVTSVGWMMVYNTYDSSQPRNDFTGGWQNVLNITTPGNYQLYFQFYVQPPEDQQAGNYGSLSTYVRFQSI